MGAEHRVSQIHSEASPHLPQLNAKHQEEISRIQHSANLAHGELDLKVQQSEQYSQTLLEKLESQQNELAEQRDRFQEMQAMVMSLQHQLTIVHHQSSPPIVPQNGTDQSDLMYCISALRNEVRQLKEDNQQRKSLMQSSSQFAMPSQYNIATPVIPVSTNQFPAGSPFNYPSCIGPCHITVCFAKPIRMCRVCSTRFHEHVAEETSAARTAGNSIITHIIQI